jgi:hypothetical protein
MVNAGPYHPRKGKTMKRMKKILTAAALALVVAFLVGLFYVAVVSMRACEFGPCLPGAGILED